MKIRKKKKSEERLQIRISDWEKTTKSVGAEAAKGYRKPGSRKK